MSLGARHRNPLPAAATYPHGKQTCAGQYLKELLGWLEYTHLLSLGMLHKPKGDLREEAAPGTLAMPMWLVHSSSERITRFFWLGNISRVAELRVSQWHCLCTLHYVFSLSIPVSKFMTSSTSTPSAGLRHPLGILLEKGQESL